MVPSQPDTGGYDRPVCNQHVLVLGTCVVAVLALNHTTAVSCAAVGQGMLVALRVWRELLHPSAEGVAASLEAPIGEAQTPVLVFLFPSGPDEDRCNDQAGIHIAKCFALLACVEAHIMHDCFCTTNSRVLPTWGNAPGFNLVVRFGVPKSMRGNCGVLFGACSLHLLAPPLLLSRSAYTAPASSQSHKGSSQPPYPPRNTSP